MASSSYNSRVGMEVEKEYPYPSNLSPVGFVSVKLSGRDNYAMWKTQMLCLVESHGMLGFIDGTFYCRRSEERANHQILLERSDAVVKGWILGSLSEEPLSYVLNCLTKTVGILELRDFSAKQLWDELKYIYASEPLEDLPEPEPIGEDQKRLHRATLSGDWVEVDTILRSGDVTVIDIITTTGNTALHVAVRSNQNPKFLKKLLEWFPEDDKELKYVKNFDGSTLLHVAVNVGNTQAANILVERSPDLLLVRDYQHKTPLAIALSSTDTKMAQFLLHCMNNDEEKDTLFSGESGDGFLVILISYKDFSFALELVEHYKTLESDVVLMALAQNFPSELNIFEKYLGTGIVGKRVKDGLESLENHMVKRCVDCVPLCGSWVKTIFWLFFAGMHGIIMLLPLILKMLAWPFLYRRVRIYGAAMQLLEKVCILRKHGTAVTNLGSLPSGPVVEASRQNAYDVVEGIVNCFPNAIWSANEDDHTIIQIAVVNRSEKVYNLIYQMSELYQMSKRKNIYRFEDSYDNNLLHLAGRLAPTDKLKLISGAALQIQRELLWFKEVEQFVSPLQIKQKNFFGETPQMVFTREHKDLLIEGENWLKATANSYTITAALITTIVFAAGITVPGGNNQDTGIPMFTNTTAFTVFAISDAISLFGAVTSLLMFLSILTARYSEQDFLLKLPTKLIFGLVTLFISTTAMIIASGAMLYLVFGQSNSRIFITIVVFTCLPIAAFVTLQSGLVLDLMSATYSPSIFGKKRDRFLY